MNSKTRLVHARELLFSCGLAASRRNPIFLFFMSRFHRHHSLLLTFCALALLLLTSASATIGAHLRYALATQEAVAVASVAGGDQHSAVAHDDHRHAHAFNADGSAGSDSQTDDDCDADDKLLVPLLMHVVLDPTRSGAPVNNPSSLQPAPLAGLLRPPRVA
jgi:hypothetical protein